MTVQSPTPTLETPQVTAGLTAFEKIEKPQNGLKGLKHWRADLFSGLLVALISTPFSIGIAVASGAPPITGIISAIIAGFVLPFIGGSYVTISGPAAGLAPILFSAMLTLGAGDLSKGYPLLLPVIAVAGVIQIILSQLKAAKYSAVFPAPVVEGMLTAIGIMIIAKQLPTLIGHKFVSHEFWGIILEAPAMMLNHTNIKVLGLGILTLGVTIVLNMLASKVKVIKALTPTLIAVVLCTLASQLVGLNKTFLINIPENPLHAIVFPDFMGLLNSPNLIWSAIGIAMTLTLVDGIESLATISAIDKIDPYRRQSKPNKTLFAMGVSNICSSMVGGLTIIPGGVKSTANIMAGGKTQWANFYNACFLTAFLFLGRDLINTLPLSVLSAVLIWTGYKLCRPRVWKKILNVGVDQFLLFTATILITLSTDLMWGIIAGIALAVVKNAYWIFKTNAKLASPKAKVQLIKSMFQNPIQQRLWHQGEYHLSLSKPLVCSNYLSLKEELENIPSKAECVKLTLTPEVLMADHTTLENLEHLVEVHNLDGKQPIELVGLEQYYALAHAKSSTRILEIEDEQVILAG